MLEKPSSGRRIRRMPALPGFRRTAAYPSGLTSIAAAAGAERTPAATDGPGAEYELPGRASTARSMWRGEMPGRPEGAPAPPAVRRRICSCSSVRSRRIFPPSRTESSMALFAYGRISRRRKRLGPVCVTGPQSCPSPFGTRSPRREPKPFQRASSVAAHARPPGNSRFQLSSASSARWVSNPLRSSVMENSPGRDPRERPGPAGSRSDRDSLAWKAFFRRDGLLSRRCEKDGAGYRFGIRTTGATRCLPSP